MKNKMLLACPDQLRGGLRGLFAQYPFEEMPLEYHRATGLHGVTFEDSSIGVFPDEPPEITLAIYLHEVAHASLLRAGHPDGLAHGNDFVRICRELQMRFGVSKYAWHAYDQQDAVIKTTHEHASKAAMAAAMAINYDPTQRAAYFAAEAVAADHRHAWRYFLVLGGGALAVVAGFAAPWAQWFAVINSALNADFVKLAAGVALAGWLWLNSRGEP